MSNSRTFGVGETWWARSISPSVVLPIAETVPTTRRPRCFASTSRRATCLILSGSATDEPPNFMTTVSKSTAAGYRAALHSPMVTGAVPASAGRRVSALRAGSYHRTDGVRPSGPANVVHCNVEHGLHLERDKVEALLDGGGLLLARHPRADEGRPRDPARGVRLPSAVARGLVAVRPAAEDRRLRRLRLPRRLRRLRRGRRGRSRRGALLLLRSLPDHAASRRRAVDRRAPRALRQARRPGRRSGPAAACGRRRPRRQLLPPPERDRRPDRRARGLDLPQGGRGAAPGDLLDEARAGEHAEGDLAASATSSPRSWPASRTSPA